MPLRVFKDRKTFEQVRERLNPIGGGGIATKHLDFWERRAKRQRALGVALLLGLFTLGFVLGAVLL